jgi:ribonucleoside-diphosphate reductase beta chain
VFPAYDHFLVLAARAQWDEADVDLRPDAAAWPLLEPGDRLRLERLIAGFCVGEGARGRASGAVRCRGR